MKRKVLFLCETNGLHGPIAAALINRIDSKNFEAVSAGTSPGRLHRLTVEVMKEIGIELSQKARKHVKDFRDEKFDFVIALDESSARACQNSEHIETIHWRIDDPASIH